MRYWNQPPTAARQGDRPPVHEQQRPPHGYGQHPMLDPTQQQHAPPPPPPRRRRRWATVEAVCPEPDVAGVVAGLVDRSMLTADTRATPTRYTLLETLRAYGRERLATTGAEHAVRRAHAEHAVAVAEAAEWGLRGPDEARWTDELVRTTRVPQLMLVLDTESEG
jgi:hypothetical protein